MIAFDELVKAEDRLTISEDVKLHLSHLHYQANKLRMAYKNPLQVDRGFSTPEEQMALYRKLGRAPKMGSMHLMGAAVDFLDPQQTLQRWILDHLEWCESQAMWFEDFSATPNWVHLQIYPYGSWEPGKSIFFKP